MASSKVMPSSTLRKSDRSRRFSSSASSSFSIRSHQAKQEAISDRSITIGDYSDKNDAFPSTMTVEGILRDVYGSDQPTETTLLDASITLMDARGPATSVAADVDRNRDGTMERAGKSVDEVWREIVTGPRKETMKEEADEIMTLEDFLVKAGAVEDAVVVAAEEAEEMDVKVPPERLSGGVYTFDALPASPFQMLDRVEGSIVGYGSGVEVYGGSVGGRGKRGRLMMEPLDKAAAQRQRRMIKNRESAARSRERKQAYQVELESLAARLEEENERLSREKAERTRERYEKLMEKVIPAVEKRRPPRLLRKIRSLEW